METKKNNAESKPPHPAHKQSKMKKHEAKTVKIDVTKGNPVPKNDGTNRPVPGTNAAPVYSKSEAALFKQAENPLGDPHKD